MVQTTLDCYVHKRYATPNHAMLLRMLLRSYYPPCAAAPYGRVKPELSCLNHRLQACLAIAASIKFISPSRHPSMTTKPV